MYQLQVQHVAMLTYCCRIVERHRGKEELSRCAVFRWRCVYRLAENDCRRASPFSSAFFITSARDYSGHRENCFARGVTLNRLRTTTPDAIHKHASPSTPKGCSDPGGVHFVDTTQSTGSFYRRGRFDGRVIKSAGTFCRRTW